jgi:hypothetical protein
VKALTFVARSGSPAGWNGKGSGTVEVKSASNGTITYTESGSWRPEGGCDLRFRNVFRWSKTEDRLCLEHLRFGEAHPVYLFDLVPAEDGQWRSVSPHLCSEDCYAATLLVLNDRVMLRWSIDGPRKQEQVEYTYAGWANDEEAVVLEPGGG